MEGGEEFSLSPHFARVQNHVNRLFSAKKSTETLALKATGTKRTVRNNGVTVLSACVRKRGSTVLNYHVTFITSRCGPTIYRLSPIAIVVILAKLWGWGEGDKITVTYH